MVTTVLLLDSDEETARLQYHLLRDAPELIVEMTDDALRAVDLATRTRPDVVVCDPSFDGPGVGELIRRLQTASPGSKVLVRSAGQAPTRVLEAVGAGAAGFLAKEDGRELISPAVIAAVRGGVVLSVSASDAVAEEMGRLTMRSRELEHELREVRDSVERGTSAKGDFVANVSHELRTPVTVAKGIAHVLGGANVTERERADFVSQLQRSLDKLAEMVDELIAIADIERGTFALEPVTTDLAPLVRNAADEVGRRYPAVGIDVQVPDRLPGVADAARIGDVVRELLDNACRFSPRGAGVSLRARVLDEGVTVSVTDHGEGLDRSVAMQAFTQPFSTGEATLRKERAGVGVGLHLARQVVVEHGGVIWSDPLPGGGTRISFCIPGKIGAQLQSPPGAA
jgi:signal transduction histidine kinase